MKARFLHEESLGIRRELGDRQSIATSVLNLGDVAWNQGDYMKARSLYGESLVIRREIGDRRGITCSLEGSGLLAASEEMPGRAVYLLAAAEAQREAIGAPLPPSDRADYDRASAAARAALGEEAYAAAWVEGRAMTMEQTIQNPLREE